MLAALLTQPIEQEPTPIEAVDIAWSGLTPLLILVGGAILLMVVAALSRRTWLPGGYALFTTVVGAGVIATSVPLWQRVQDTEQGPFSTVYGAFGIDGFSLFATVVIAASVILGGWLFDGYLRREGLEGAEPYILMMLSASGGIIMASANDLIVMFLGLEVLSIAVYVLAAMHLRRITSQEAGVKYFVLGAFASAFFLYGVAMVYGGTGSTNLQDIATLFSESVLRESGLVLAGIGLLLVGFAFKIAAVPFHFWTPDAYQGAPTPSVAYMASGVKVAAFAGLLRVFFLGFDAYRIDWQPIVWGLAAVTLLAGSILAIVQTDVKRMMAYSSISHAGFILLGVQAASDDGIRGALFYLAAYTFMVAGTFGVITLVSRRGDIGHSLDDYRGLARVRPALALAFAILLFAQAGVPLTSGFVAKFYVITAAVDAGSTWLAVIAMVSAVIAAFLYLRIIVAMFMSSEEDEVRSRASLPIPFAAGLALCVAVGFTLLVGMWPDLVGEPAQDAVPVLIPDEGIATGGTQTDLPAAAP